RCACFPRSLQIPLHRESGTDEDRRKACSVYAAPTGFGGDRSTVLLTRAETAPHGRSAFLGTSPLRQSEIAHRWDRSIQSRRGDSAPPAPGSYTPNSPGSGPKLTFL